MCAPLYAGFRGSYGGVTGSPSRGSSGCALHKCTEVTSALLTHSRPLARRLALRVVQGSSLSARVDARALCACVGVRVPPLRDILNVAAGGAGRRMTLKAGPNARGALARPLTYRRELQKGSAVTSHPSHNFPSLLSPSPTAEARASLLSVRSRLVGCLEPWPSFPYAGPLAWGGLAV